ncbi:MAG: sigma-70 family RNA polymerase sigma factor [Bdellovibrionaceae bacterium]|nr:sigma-70 family RNA polymerase sigma factor [Pseudobdellovibrionaceae bacterium]NUM60329.1 sigma-70 family RNA polymerase sigma factor [Pseudobdellovibrionaceae bacterium]
MSDKFKDLTKKDDEELMVLYQNGSNLAFDRIYDRYSGRIYNYFYKKRAQSTLAQDLTQETFLKLHRSKNLYKNSLPFAPWIFSISKSVFLDYLKKSSFEESTPSEDLNKFTDKVSLPIAESTEFSSEDFLKVLPTSQEKVVQMRVVDEATFNEIAIKLNTTPENVRQIFSRAVKKLRSQFAKTGEK